MQWADREALRLALLPGKLLARHQIERDVYNWHQLAVEFFLRPKIAHLDVVVLVEPREWIFFPVRIGSAEVSANQPFTIHTVQRKLVRIDQARHDKAREQK